MAFKPSRIKKHQTGFGEVKLNLTSMMDMFTIILVFLLKVYSTHGQLIQPSAYLTLPKSTVDKPPEVALDLTVTYDEVTASDGTKSYEGWIAVNEKPVERIDRVIKREDLIIPRLQRELLKYAKKAKKMERLYGTPFTGKITIQGDRKIPYRLLVKVMATCGRSEYPNMRLVVYREGE